MKKKYKNIIGIGTIVIVMALAFLITYTALKPKEEKIVEAPNMVVPILNEYTCDVNVTYADSVRSYYAGVNFDISETYSFDFGEGLNSGVDVITYKLKSQEDFDNMIIPQGDYEILFDGDNLTKSIKRHIIFDYEYGSNGVDEYINHLGEIGVVNCHKNEG